MVWWYCAKKGGAFPKKGAVATLSNLDPSDPRLLPDGSRRVDAEALRLVCLHVAAEVTS